MNKLVKNLLMLNQLEFGNSTIQFERFDIVQLIDGVLSSLDYMIKQNDITVIFSNQIPVYVYADEFQIEGVVTNYITNAIHHAQGKKVIQITLEQKEKTVCVHVYNSGTTIPEDELDKIWVKFYKVDKARTREYGGSGIGLSIVKAIMKSHGQNCGVLNHKDGVEFWFELDAELA
jgi:signal transduction histidine kinase